MPFVKNHKGPRNTTENVLTPISTMHLSQVDNVTELLESFSNDSVTETVDVFINGSVIELVDIFFNQTSTDRNQSSTRQPRSGFRLPWGFYPAIEAAQLASIICLILTAFVYRRLPEFRNLPGKNLVSLCMCLTFTYVFLFVDFAFGTRWIRPQRTACLALASLTHLAFLAVFAWTNVLAYDIWHTVSRTDQPNETSCGKRRANRRYLWYSFYAWTSTAVVGFPVLAQAWGSLDWTPLPNPNLGLGRCWLSGQKSFLVYFNCPVGVALLVNMIFFVMTAKTMARIRNLTQVLNVQQHRKRFNLYLKLFLVMGFVWLIEFLPLVTGVYILYAVAGFLTCLHGVALFVIFVCKARVLKAVRKMGTSFCCGETSSSKCDSSGRTTRIQSRTTITTSLSNITSAVNQQK